MKQPRVLLNLSGIGFCSTKTGRILFNGQNMPDVMILAFRKRGMDCFKNQKTCTV